MSPRDARNYHAPDPDTPIRTSITRMISLAFGVILIVGCGWYYWTAQGGDDAAPARASVIIPVPVQAQLSDGHLLGARVALDLREGSVLKSNSQGGATFLSSDEEIERVASIITGYVTVRGHEAFTGANLARARREIGQQLAKSGLGVERIKFIDLTVIPPGGTWLLNS